MAELGHAGPERDEEADQVARVHGRDVERGERCEGQRVVPVEEVTAEPLEPRHGLERLLEPLGAAPGRDVPEVEGREGGEEGEADVGRRGPVRDPLDRVLLVVVRRQPVLRGTHEDLEVPPRPPGDRAEEPDLARGQDRDRFDQRATQVPGDCRRHEPEAR